nr:venom carboxylesterase-6-like [Onthophagus taurus]
MFIFTLYFPQNVKYLNNCNANIDNKLYINIFNYVNIIQSNTCNYKMKNVLIALLIAVLICFVICDEHQHLKHKKKHEYNHKEKHSNKNHKKHHQAILGSHFNKRVKSKRVQGTISVNLGGNRQIEGVINKTNTGKDTRYFGFQGIPYAKPPVGDLRFEPPQKYVLKGNYSATYQRNICIQSSTAPIESSTKGNEDCLYLNVYSPNLTSKLAVLVWIHGGGFYYGDGNYESRAPDNFIDQNLVVVTLNYRLGVFGFLSSGDDVVPGNMGLKDQAMALEWVQENIGYFGGNPKNVTIMGESTGGASVAYLVQSPVTKGLFHQAIMHSGNSLCPWALSRTAERNFWLLASEILYFGTNKTEAMIRMKQVAPTLLYSFASLSKNSILLNDPLNGLVYAPVIETSNPTELFSYKSYEQLNSGNFTKVPIIIGYNSEEGEGFNDVVGLPPFILLTYDFNPGRLVPLDMNVNDTQKNKVDNEIQQTYVENGIITVTYISHDEFVRPILKYVELYSKWTPQVYLYRFSYNGNSTQGVAHTGELPYFFYDSKLTAAQKAVSNKVVNLWSQFIKYGNPTPNEFNITWTPSFQANDYSYLDIGEEFVVYNQSVNPEKMYLDKWTYWYNTYGNRPYDTY